MQWFNMLEKLKIKDEEKEKVLNAIMKKIEDDANEKVKNMKYIKVKKSAIKILLKAINDALRESELKGEHVNLYQILEKYDKEHINELLALLRILGYTEHVFGEIWYQFKIYGLPKIDFINVVISQKDTKKLYVFLLDI